jgi:hypothetical protein
MIALKTKILKYFISNTKLFIFGIGLFIARMFILPHYPMGVLFFKKVSKIF